VVGQIGAKIPMIPAARERRPTVIRAQRSSFDFENRAGVSLVFIFSSFIRGSLAVVGMGR
jgi:hypothetical protein